MLDNDTARDFRPYRRPAESGERIWSLNVRDIDPDPAQARRIFEQERLRELAESIRQLGVIQPLVVRKTGNRFTLIAGERRLRAAAMAGLSHVPCVISQASEEKAACMALVENLQRRDLDCFEEAEGIAKLIRLCGITQEEAAARLGKSQSAVANKLRLLKLGPEGISAVRRAGLTERHARALLRLAPEAVPAAAEEIKTKKLSVAETESFVEGLLSAKRPKPAARPGKVGTGRRELGNAISSAVESARAAGFDVALERRDTAESVCYTVVVRKKR